MTQGKGWPKAGNLRVLHQMTNVTIRHLLLFVNKLIIKKLLTPVKMKKKLM